MVETTESGLCSLCAMVPSRTSCTLPGCKNSIVKAKVVRSVATVVVPNEAIVQMEELHRLVERNSKK